MTIRWIALAVALASLAVVCWNARKTSSYARQSQDSARRAQAANREAWGMLAEVQLRSLKRRR
ncbi:hypothetical protein ABT090_20910 [Streptomyces asoensis]|uniref:hypothetical protein n=1 Tax=Streptomyces asoensis TaxID=249586 RepID=UPI0033256A98